MEYYIDKETKKRFDSLENYQNFISENGFSGVRYHNRFEYENGKDGEVITKQTLGMIDCSTILLRNVLTTILNKWKD